MMAGVRQVSRAQIPTLAAAAVLAIATLAAPAVAAAPAAAAAGAGDRKLEMQAREAFAAGRYDEALNAFAKLYAETLHPVYLRNIGRCHQKMRQPDKAIDSFRDYLAKAKKLPAEERTEVEGYIREMEALRTEQAQAAKPPVEPLSGTSPTPPPPPRPDTTGTQPAGSTPTGTTTTTPPLVTTTPPPPAPAGGTPIYKRWWFWTGIGVVVAGGVVAAILLTRDQSECPATQCM
jgi:hypothetical protein